ncbi:MAG: carbamoyl-phosphate synthase (glutamine-hydrolyzing) large subunit [Candidatus Sericytochromatia bacterium]|nr:carbamoyl-phosphate synthase (glutamine-hydrolyzing) large subunit [Candidatus Sericytochromatia bacterium]
MRKVLVIGSGPIIIGQAAEFDYAGTQACQALREEGIEVVLVNSNPATIMTDLEVAHRVYVEPLTVATLEAIIAVERHDGLLPTMGGQTALNLAIELAEIGVLAQYNVTLLGTSLTAINTAEDRELFKQLMVKLGQPVAPSLTCGTLDEALGFAAEIGFPLIVRPAFTLGGTGSGICNTLAELTETCRQGLIASPTTQVLVERSIKGWQEIEYEVLRDANDTCITICNMENLDPVGVHTGDSIVVAPSQTLSDRDYQMLRNASLEIVRALQIEGGCNVQFALDPHSFDYAVIEVNPRVSRSSALASKATGYPIARMAAKIAVGKALDEILNPITGVTYASFEPMLDYIVVKMPRWPFDKFPEADRRLGTQMKATGEVMAIARTFEAALHKAIRSLEIGTDGLYLTHLAKLSIEALSERLQNAADDERLFVMAEAIRRGIDLAEIHRWTLVDLFFLHKLERMVNFETEWQSYGTPEAVPVDVLRKAKRLGFADSRLATLIGDTEMAVRAARKRHDIIPAYKIVDTCAGEFPAKTPYFYSTYTGKDEPQLGDKPRALVLGSGPIRIGQGIEFDYCSVHAVRALQAAGYDVIMLNSNPETVSTDFDVADRLYFEPLTLEDTLNVIERENVEGVFVQFGGQTAINLAGKLAELGVRIFGTSVDSIDRAEDRHRFRVLLDELGISQTKGSPAGSLDEALAVAATLGYPLMLRPSYVIGGRAMQVATNEGDLRRYLVEAVSATPETPILLDQYKPGKEVEVDAICDGETVLIPGIFEHIERAGVHSGDSMAVYPPQSLTQAEVDGLVRDTVRIARALGIIGLVNLQFVIADGETFVLEVNPRASRTIPILSKVTGIPMVALATRVQIGETLKAMGYEHGLFPDRPLVAVKAPSFSFAKMGGVDIFLGPEMKSTGEILGIARDFGGALAKVFQQKSLTEPTVPGLLCAIADRDKAAAVPLVRKFQQLGWSIFATPGTATVLSMAGLTDVNVVGWDHDLLSELLRSGRIAAVLNLPTLGRKPERGGFQLRRMAVDYGVTCITALETAAALHVSLQHRDMTPIAINQYFTERAVETVVP